MEYEEGNDGGAFEIASSSSSSSSSDAMDIEGADDWLVDHGAGDASPAIDGDPEDGWEEEAEGARCCFGGSASPLRRTNLPALTGAILASGTTGGITYAFGMYSSALKHTLRLTQGQLDTVSSAFFMAGLLSWAPGMVSDRYGPRCSLAAGGVTSAISLMAFYAVATEAVEVPRPLLVTTLSGLGVCSFMSSALVTGAVFKLIVASTGPGTKGKAVGSAKGYVGLGSGAYACLFEALRGSIGAAGGGETPLPLLPPPTWATRPT